MKCREAEYWLYSLRPNTSWPADVATHLQGCRECQLLQARLKQVDTQINQLTKAPSNPSAKAQLMALIEETPQVRGSSHAETDADAAWPWVRRLAYLGAAAAILFFGWLLGHSNVGEREVVRTVEVVRERPIEIIREKLINTESQSERNLFASLLKHNARLVQSTQLKDRLDSLLDMADDCRKHALTLIEVGPREALPFTIDLYTHLLRDGVVVQVQQAPLANRAALKETARTRLQKMADSVSAAEKPLPKVLEEHRDALECVALESLEDVEKPAPKLMARKETQSGPVAPAAALVNFAIAFSVEPDPVAKADTCSQCVQRLTPFMMVCLGEDGATERADMGQQFGELIRFGVYAPLATTTTEKEPPQTVKDQTERIFQTTFAAVSQMEKHLEVAPERAKPAIEKALEASKKGKGKGPAWLRDPFSTPEKSKKGKSGNGKNQKKANVDLPIDGPERWALCAKPQASVAMFQRRAL